jgi:hypothetical protein
VNVVSVGDLVTDAARATRAAWMRRLDVGDRPAPHPAPVVPGRPITPDDGCPGSVPGLVLRAVDAGWHVQVIYAAGTTMHANSKPGRLVESVSVRCWRFPNERAVLLWHRPVPGGSWGAVSGWVWAAGHLPVDYGVQQATDWVTKGITPVRTADQPAADKGACRVCAGLFKINKNGTLGVHGPKTERCLGGKHPPLAVTREG